MKSIKIDLPDYNAIELHALSDLHIGDPLSDGKRILDTVDYIQKTPNAYCVLNGDLMDTAIKSSIGDLYGAALQPMEQLKQCVKIFEPIKDRILCVDPGNHEHRIYKADGIDITALMCAQLGLQGRYTPTTALLFIRFGQDPKHKSQNERLNRKLCYTVYCTHGSGGGRREGGKINRLSDLASIVDADLYIHGHTHLPAVIKKNYFRSDKCKSCAKEITRTFVNTAAALNYGGYGDVQGYSPAARDNPVIYLSGTENRITVKL